MAGASPHREAAGEGAEVPPVASLFDLGGQVALVTGGSRGIGAGIAHRLAEAGADVVVVHRDPSGAERAAAVVEDLRALGHRALAVEADLSQGAAVGAMVDRAVAAFGRLDILVNDAGLQPVVELLAMGVDDWDAIQAVNARALFLATQAAARQMIAQGGGGAIVDIASIEGLQPAFGHSHYNASKAAVIMHARSAALELGPHGIRVNAIAPGLVDTGNLAVEWPEGVARWHAAAPLGRLGSPADVADACLFLCSPAARWISGATLVVDGGVLAHPTW